MQPLTPWDAGATSTRPLEPAETRLARLAAAVGPLRRVLAAIAARLIETRAHSRLCYARLSDYARERAGLSARQLQELARVHRALVGLPALERALLANELPWSKVRLLARVANAEDEHAWIAHARAVPTRRLAQDVRGHPRSIDEQEADDAEPQTWVTVRCSPAVREKWSLVRELAERVAGRRLRDADALELVAAEAFSALSIDAAHLWMLEEPPEPRCGDRDRTRPGEGLPSSRAPARIPPAELASLAAGLEGADAFELDRRLRLVVRLEQTLDAAMAPLLRVVACGEYEWSTRYHTLSSYAREELGMPESKARALLRLERAADVCPELREAYRSGRLSWLKARCLLPLLLLDVEGDWRPIWVAWAERVTLRRLERDVERALLLRAGTCEAWHRCKFHPEAAQDAVSESERSMCAHEVDPDATEQLRFRVPLDVAALFRAVRETLRVRLRARCDAPPRDPQPLEGDVFDALLDGAALAWLLRDPRARRPDPIFERDGYQCAIPGCTSRRSLENHHVVYRSRGGADTQENRLTLCTFHHQRCVHADLLRVCGRAPDELVFELPLGCYRSGDVEIPETRKAA